MPAQLSVPYSEWRGDADMLDNVVIGSGYGGAVAALRLAEAGQRVVVLERGAEYLPGDFPNDIALVPKYVRTPAPFGPGIAGQPTGLFEWHVGARMIALTGNGLGGGSLINAGVALAPDADVLRHSAWPAAIRHGLDPRRLSLPYAMARARRMLGAKRWHDAPPLLKTHALQRIAPYLQPGATARPVRVTVDSARCTRCGDCATGCNHEGAKLTLRDTYLVRALEAGATLVSCATVAWIAPLRDAWQVVVRPTEREGAPRPSCHERVLVARRVVLAAGSLGSTELLQRSRERAGERFTLSPALGSRFSGNGDSLSFVADDVQRTNAMGCGAGPREPVGPTITAVVDLRRDRAGAPHAMSRRLVVQDGAIPGAIARAAQEMLATGYTISQLDRVGFRVPRGAAGRDPLAAGALAQRTQVLLTMGHDGAPGRLVRLPERDRTVPWWPGDPADNPTYQRQAEVFSGIDDAGAVHLHPPNWAPLPAGANDVMSGPSAQSYVLTVHPLGGCPMGDHFDDAVVDDIGRVWRAAGERWEGLLVLDGSIVPTSLGVNPLLTITALAERAMAHLLAGRPKAPQPAALPHVRRGGTDVHDPQAPRALARERFEPALHVSLSERLTCDAMHPPNAYAELRLEMESQDWLAMWDNPRHRVALQRGRLRLERAGAPAHEWDVTDGWFELLPACPMPFARPPTRPRGAQGLWRALRRLADRGVELLQAASAHAARLDLWATWWLVRGRDDVLRAVHQWRVAGGPPWSCLRLAGLVKTLAHGLAQAAEERTMVYRLALVRRDTSPGEVPRDLTMIGTKRIGYRASWWTLSRWWWRHRTALRRGHSVPPPRESFWEQVTDPHIVLFSGHRPGPVREFLARRWPALALPWAHGRFRLDPAAFVARAPLHMHTGDLTSGLQALAAYPALFTRYALKTRLLDFRLPDYTGTAVADGDVGGDPVRVGGIDVWPQRIDLVVPRGRSSCDPPSGLPPTLTLRLWRYRTADATAPRVARGQWFGHEVWRARSVLLLHAFAQSSSMFTLPSVQPNFAATLLEQGFDVWLLEHRISTRLPYTGMPSTMDQIARHDIPTAVKHMLGKLQSEHADELPANARLQVFAFGQCIGAAALAMALLRGQLSHGVASHEPQTGEPPAPLLPMLAAAVLSQTHPYHIGQPITQAKTWLPALLRNLLPTGAVPFGVRTPVHNLPEAWLDRVLASLPVPADEHCPGERDVKHKQDDCATCRRIRFIEAPLFKHRNLSPETHADLPRLFGAANLHLFAQAARCVENERLVDEDGAFVYVHDRRLREHFGLPVAFLHGLENELFHPDSARRSAHQYGGLFPAFAQQVSQALQTGRNGAAWLVPGFGHVDVVIGRDAPQKIFQPIVRLFDTVHRGASTPTQPPSLTVLVSARPPRAGPWLGHVERTATRLRVSLAFLIDDRYSDAKQGPDGMPGDRTWALVRSGNGPSRRTHRLAIEPLRQSQAPTGSSGYRIAHGTIDLDVPAAGRGLSLLALSVHESLAQEGTDAAGEFEPAHPTLHAAAPTIADATFDAWLAVLLRRRARNTRRARQRAECIDPTQRSVSRQRREALGPAYGRACLLPHTVHGLASHERVCFAAASCRYPGWPFDRHRTDDAARALAAWARTGRDGAPAFGVLLGDQIYADATAGLVDPLSAVERYFERHRQAFARGLRQPLGPRDQTLGDLLAALPVYFAQDDHEFRDGWPDSGALDRGHRSGSRHDLRTFVIARDAVRGFQRLHMPAPLNEERDSSYRFAHGPVRFFVLDTRTGRRVGPDGSRRLLDPGTFSALEDWLAEPEAATHLNCLASGSVIVPRLAPGSDPSDPRDDSTAWAPEDRARLLHLVHRCATHATPRRMLLLSADYHMCAALTLRIAGRAAAAAVVAPALYAPLLYADAKPESLWLNEDLRQYGGMAIEPHGAWSGNGFCAIEVQRAGGGFSVSLRRWLRSHARHESQGSFGDVVNIDID